MLIEEEIAIEICEWVPAKTTEIRSSTPLKSCRQPVEGYLEPESWFGVGCQQHLTEKLLGPESCPEEV